MAGATAPLRLGRRVRFLLQHEWLGGRAARDQDVQPLSFVHQQNQNPGAEVPAKSSQSPWRGVCLCRAQRLFSETAWWLFSFCFYYSFLWIQTSEILNLALESKTGLAVP